jgi:hypothetical protein
VSAPQMPCRRAQVASRASSCGTTADRRAVAASRSDLHTARRRRAATQQANQVLRECCCWRPTAWDACSAAITPLHPGTHSWNMQQARHQQSQQQQHQRTWTWLSCPAPGAPSPPPAPPAAPCAVTPRPCAAPAPAPAGGAQQAQHRHSTGTARHSRHSTGSLLC